MDREMDGRTKGEEREGRGGMGKEGERGKWGNNALVVGG